MEISVTDRPEIAMPQYRLLYFNSQGLGELPRLIFHFAGVPFEDVRIESSEWPEIKPSMAFYKLKVRSSYTNNDDALCSDS